VIAHAFQFADNVDRGDDRAQVAGGWLLGGDQRQALFLDVVPLGVDPLVFGDDLSGQVLVLILE